MFVSAKPTGAAPKSKRDGWGSARALKPEWFVRPTPVGEKVREIAPPLFGEIEKRWEQRFGAATVDELRRALAPVIGGLDVELPEYLPIVDGSERDGRRDRRARGCDDCAPPVRTSRAGAPRVHARLRAQVGAVVAADRELRARLRQGGNRRPRATRDRRRVQGSDDHGAELPEEDRLRLGRGEARSPDGQRPGGAGGRSRAARGGRTRMEAATAAQSHGRSPRSAQALRGLAARIRMAGGRGRATWSRRTPSSTTRRDDCRTTRWCSTGAVGRTAPSFGARRPRSAPPFPSLAARAYAPPACRAAACGRSPRRARPRPPALRTPAGTRG